VRLLSAGAILVCALALASPWSAAAPPPAAAAGDCTADGALDPEELAFLALINAHRAQNGRAPLAVSYKLSKAAQWKSQDMGANAYFAHDDLDRSWVQRIRDCGYGYNTWLGENIAAGISSASSAFNLWKNSSGHNANMLSANYTTIGIGRAYAPGSPYGWYWTTEFGGYDDGYVTALNPPSVPLSTGSEPDLTLRSKSRHGETIFRAHARDPQGIDRVEFFADGALVGVDSRAPYVLRWRGPARDVVAVAYDRQGNVAGASAATRAR